MKVQKISSRGYLFSFAEPYQTNSYVIKGDKYLYILDTFLGPEPMNNVLNHLRENGIEWKRIFVFNSHNDYDHVWGNCFFKKAIILSHFKCYELLESKGGENLEKYKSHALGKVKLVLPNFTFTDRIILPDDNLEFFYSPGHTVDSASCFDRRDDVLYVGDNIESPLPYIRIPNIQDYIKALKEYLSLDVKIIISGHDEIHKGNTVIEDTLQYLENFKLLNIDIAEFTERKAKILHYTNLKTYGTLLKDSEQIDKGKKYLREAIQLLRSMPDDLEGKSEELNVLDDMINS
ncbi:MAG: MBL fold metallo-hydrolase [Candidatus Lokiarchaeota archaeon]|nr:MBL fold metallo-hydrolase [Candidatus Lokiarchaeota archaeon]MBD3201195.1 MBL fold metallo-hydrolase [Candidatus Lokiarchaeota archaeon]